MSTNPNLLLDTVETPAQHLLIVFLTVVFGLVAGMALGMLLMSDLLSTLGG